MLLVAISAYFYGHRQGQAVIQAEWQAEKAEANAQAALAIKKAQDAAIATERRQAAQFRAVEAKLIADNRKSAKGTNNSNGLPEATTSASGNQPETICYLPEEFVRDLATEAERADQIVYQLTACQMILEEERK